MAYKDREIDKFCIVLISKDQEAETKIREITNEKPDFRTVIPFIYEELATLGSGQASIYIKRRLRKVFSTRDLFNNRNPLEKDTYFFGRQEVIQKLYSSYKSGEHSGLFGLQKIGKTSVLKALIRRLESNGETVVYIECQLFYEKHWHEFLCLIIKKIIENLQNSDQVRYKPIRTLVDQLNPECLEYQENNAGELFAKHLELIHQSTKKTRILIILDEIENITFGLSPEAHWRESKDYRKFWEKIRGVFQSKPGLFSFIVCGINSSITERHSLEEKGNPICPDNPIRLLISPLYLSGFELSQVREMICCISKYMGLDFDDGVITSLASEYGGNPFLIRQACSEIYKISGKDRPTRITTTFYENHNRKINLAVREVVDSILDTLKKYYEEEYILCTFLANGEYNFFDDYVKSSRDLIRHAEDYGLIQEINGRYEFRIQVVKDRLREVSSRLPIPSTISTVEKNYIHSLITKRETGTIEFKSTLRWNIREGKIDKQMEQEVVKAVAAFMNTNGGTILIGVEDNGRVIGLENDYKAWGNSASTDTYLRYLTDVLIRYFNIDLSCRLCKAEILQIDGKHICQIIVSQSEKPVFVKYSGEECFFVRNGASSRKLLDSAERENYCKEHFRSKS